MVFGLFGTRKAPAPVPDQLRTPSPSESASGATAPPRSPSPPPAPTDAAPDLAALLARLKRIPPKSLHAYVLTHLPAASPADQHLLATFFATLSPPPTLHCVRCHKKFVDVENDDRSCKIPHDDESAEVEKIGHGRGKGTYETLWGCCARTVEGDGDQGPPDGWCYEGKHTTDVKRARFRADSTPSNDKLVSCARKHCFDPKRRAKKREARARSEASDDHEFDDDDAEEEELHPLSPPGVSKSEPQPDDPMDVVEEADRNPTSPGIPSPSPNDETEPAKPRSKVETMQPASARPNPFTPPPKPKPRKQKSMASVKAKSAVTEELGAAGESAQAVTTSISAPLDPAEAPTGSASKVKPAKKKRSRKSTTDDGGKYVPPQDNGHSDSDDGEMDEVKTSKGKRGGRAGGGGGGKRRKVDA